jgi:GTP1/Obg family GTP-binding protein
VAAIAQWVRVPGKIALIQPILSQAIDTTTSNIDSPTIQQRQINSTVAINSGETVVKKQAITLASRASRWCGIAPCIKSLQPFYDDLVDYIEVQ